MRRLLARTIFFAAAALPTAAALFNCAEAPSDAAGEGVSFLAGASSDLVISQVYGGGGLAGAPWANDYVELFNRGGAPVPLAGKAIQYAGGNKAFSKSADVLLLDPAKSVAPGAYFLVRLGTSGEAGPEALPTPDQDSPAEGAITMGKDKGKVALVSSAQLLDGCGTASAPCSVDGVLDFVGYGEATQAERAPVAALDMKTAAFRRGVRGADDRAGCRDSDDNAEDFMVAPAQPRNSQAAPFLCVTAAADAAALTPDAGGPTAPPQPAPTQPAPTQPAPTQPAPPSAPAPGQAGAPDAGKDKGEHKDAGDDEDPDDEPSAEDDADPSSSGAEAAPARDAGRSTIPKLKKREVASCTAAPGDHESTTAVGALLALAVAVGRRRRR